LPNVGPYIYDVSISGFTRSSIYIYIYIYDISSLRVNRRPKLEAQFPYTANPCGLCGAQSGNWIGLPVSTLVFSCQYYSIDSVSLISF